MRFIFVGPSLYGVKKAPADLKFCPPASLGDITRAVIQGADAIGLVDGIFGSAASVWHKEILFALSRNVKVFGASSMGALRAAECQRFGMVPVGKIAALYCNGHLQDDAAVALAHGPAELDFAPLSIPLVEFDLRLKRMNELDLLTLNEMQQLQQAAEAIFYADRSLAEVLRRSHIERHRWEDLERLYEKHTTSQKTSDALELISEIVKHTSTRQHLEIVPWRFETTPTWRKFLRRYGDDT